MPRLDPNLRSSSTGQLVGPRPQRFSSQPADLREPTGTWYVFDNYFDPARTVAVCPAGAADAANVETGLGLLAELGVIIDQVIAQEADDATR